MTQLYPVAGCKFFIGNAAMDHPGGVDLAASDFSAVTWVEVKGWQSMGSLGDTRELVSQPIIDNSRVSKAKGTKNAGNMENMFSMVPTDAGQLKLIEAVDSIHNYPVKIELNDAPAVGADPFPSQRLFAGLFMTQSEVAGDANSPRNLQATVEINSNVVRVAAGPGV